MPITDEELKAIFRANDYTTFVSKYDASKATKAENRIHDRAKELFYKSWCSRLTDMGGKAGLKNFSKDYPVKLLEKADENIISGKVMEILGDAEQLSPVFEVFFSAMEKPLEDAISEQAETLGKSVDALADDELIQAVDKVADSLVNFMIGKMMVSQSVPEILQITKKNGAHEDFSQGASENYARIDFTRKWEHSRTKLGKMLSLELRDPNDISLACYNEEKDDEATFVVLVERFLSFLQDETDRSIVKLRLQKKTQKEIASTLGFASQGAIAKRLKKIREQYEAFLKSNK